MSRDGVKKYACTLIVKIVFLYYIKVSSSKINGAKIHDNKNRKCSHNRLYNYSYRKSSSYVEGLRRVLTFELHINPNYAFGIADKKIINLVNSMLWGV